MNLDMKMVATKETRFECQSACMQYIYMMVTIPETVLVHSTHSTWHSDRECGPLVNLLQTEDC